MSRRTIQQQPRCLPHLSSRPQMLKQRTCTLRRYHGLPGLHRSKCLQACRCCMCIPSNISARSTHNLIKPCLQKRVCVQRRYRVPDCSPNTDLGPRLRVKDRVHINPVPGRDRRQWGPNMQSMHNSTGLRTRAGACGDVLRLQSSCIKPTLRDMQRHIALPGPAQPGGVQASLTSMPRRLLRKQWCNAVDGSSVRTVQPSV